MCVIMLVCWVPLSAVDPQAFGVLFSPPSRSLKRDCQRDSGSRLGQWLPSPPYPLALACRQPAQISWPSFLLGKEGPGLEQRWRGWNGDRGEGGVGGGTFEPVFPFTASSPHVFSLLSERLVPDLPDLRWEERCKVQTNTESGGWLFEKEKIPTPAVRSAFNYTFRSRGGERGNTSPFIWKNTNKLCIHLATLPLRDPLEDSSAAAISPLLVSMYHVSLTLTVLQFSSCSSECTKYLCCLIWSAYSRRGLSGRPLLASNLSSFSHSWRAAQPRPGTFMHFQSKRVGMTIKLRFKKKQVCRTTERPSALSRMTGGSRLHSKHSHAWAWKALLPQVYLAHHDWLD